jgi:Flp pilus assembly protein TadG
MAVGRLRSARGQVIVIVALIIVVLFGFLGLAIDGGRAYLDRRGLQAAVDGAALAAAYKYMNTTNYSQAEQAATSLYANNSRLYMSPACSGYGTLAVTCAFGDPTDQTLSIAVVNKAIAGVSFTVTAEHRIPVTIMQVLGAGPRIMLSARATAVARTRSTTAASIQTLSPDGCRGSGSFSLRITGTSNTSIVGDVWANGAIVANGSSTATVNGDVVDICPENPPPINGFTVTGNQGNGWALPDPGYPMPQLNAASRTWSRYAVVSLPGTYSTDPHLTGGDTCYFLAGGAYTWLAGLTLNGGFVSNELRPPDEPSLTATTVSLSGTISSIAVRALSVGIPGGSNVTVSGQAFTVSSAGVASGATSIPVNTRAVTGTIAIGTTVVTDVRANNQFWDVNGVHCGGSFQPHPNSSGSGNPAIPPTAYGVKVTSVRWAPYGVPSCSGPATSSCFLRESAPSVCRLVDIGSNEVMKVWVSNVPGATAYNVYVSNGSCAGPFGYLGQISNTTNETNQRVSGCAPTLARNATPPTPFNNCDLGSSSQTFNGNNWPPDFAVAPPDPEGPPAGPAPLPNSDAGPAAATPPAGDRANENQCLSSAGIPVACPTTVNSSYITPGAVLLFLPGCGTTSSCCSSAISMSGGADIYLYSGQQFARILVYEPGPEQSPPPNTCANTIAGHGVTSLLGIFYLPAASVTITGSSGYMATIAGGVIAWTATINGNGSVSIVGDPSLLTWPPSVHLTQ